ncbi:MAG: fumarylacetoacetate hydrolase family protein [Candidatus Dadabacteria bacterium]|nr:fumarylacetoacetate hydrolase family protein [Candidatus Dadabacteria bacterium]
MKYLRYEDKDKIEKYGVLEGEVIREIEWDMFGDYMPTDTTHNINEVKILPPCTPTKIVAVGLNYREHTEEMNRDLPKDPRLFIKPSTAVIGHEDTVIYPDHMSSRVDYEGELAVVIGRTAKDVNVDEALDYVFGYTCLNDITARDLQAKDIQFTRAKGFDTFAPFGPVIETELDPFNLDIATYLNGELKQSSNTSMLLFNVPQLISFISNVMTLLPGDIISTGTPSGVGPMSKGDKVEVRLQCIGTLRNYIG